MNHVKRIRVIECYVHNMDKETRLLYVSEFHHVPGWGPVGFSHSPEDAIDYSTTQYQNPYYDFQRINYDAVLAADLAKIRLVGDEDQTQSCVWYCKSFSVVEFDIVTTVNEISRVQVKAVDK